MSTAVVIILVALALAIAIEGVRILGGSNPLGVLEGDAEAAEKEFTAYVAQELEKAKRGAVNAEDWAIALVDEWRKRGQHG